MKDIENIGNINKMIIEEPKKQKILKPLTGRVIPRKLWAFDIETYGTYNKFIMGSIMGDKNINEVFWNKDDFLRFLKIKFNNVFRNGFICATNLSFDIMSLLYETKFIRDLKPIIRGSDMITGKVYLDHNDKDALTFIDTFNYYHFSVKKWGEILGIPKLEKPSFLGHRPKGQKQKDYLEKYNKQDSLITYSAIKFLQNGFNDLGCNLKPTIASTGMDLFRRKFMEGLYFQPEKRQLMYLYNGYYGGRTEVIKRGRIKNCNYYDVNSLYPSVMLNEYPSPTQYKYSKNISMSAIEKYEGVCECLVKTPDLYIPYLPYRDYDNKKLLFPKGNLRGFYTFFELRRAMELGYRIKKIYSGIIYFEKFFPFVDYVSTLYDMRKQYRKDNDEREVIVKLLLNSLYGKWAQKIDARDIIMHQTRVTLEDINKYDVINEKGDFFIFRDKKPRIPTFVNPIFSIYTTAYARDKLYNYISACGKQIYYYDTDSLITKKEFNTSEQLGHLKDEGFIKDGILVRPKMYLIDDIGKCKGLGYMNKEEFVELLFFKKRKVTRFSKFKETNKRELHYNEILSYLKVVSLEDNKRKWGSKFNPDVLQDSEPLVV